MDRRGQYLNTHMDRRADRASKNGHIMLAARLDRRGDHMERHLDRKGSLMEHHMNRHADRMQRKTQR